MKNISFILFFLISFVGNATAQKLAKKAYIKVIGTERYKEFAKGRAIELTFVEDPNRCDPVRGNLTLKEQLGYFSKELAKNNINFVNFEETSQTPSMRLKHQNFKYVAVRFDEIEKIQQAAALQNIQVKEVYYVMPEHHFDQEDMRAIAALNDATRRAKAIAAKMGAKKVSVISIDDDTSTIESDDFLQSLTANSQNESESEMEHYRELLDMLLQYEGNDGKSFDISRKGGYSLYVTFQVE